MLNKIDFKRQIAISVIFVALTMTLFSIAVFGILGTPYEGHILLNYFFMGVAFGLYVFILIQLKLNAAFLLFVLGYVFSFGTLYYVYSFATEGFGELAGFLGWMIIMALVVALGITLEILLHIRRKQRIQINENKHVIEAEVVEAIETYEDEEKKNLVD